jgi:hypothetical protein
MTSIEWLIDQLIPEDQHEGIMDIIEDAKERHKQEIIDAWEMGRFNIDDFGLGEEYYQETFVSKGSDECHFEPTTNTSSATICVNCGREKFLHKF